MIYMCTQFSTLSTTSTSDVAFTPIYDYQYIFVVLAEARKQSSVLFFIARRSLSTPLIGLIAYYAKSRNRTELHAQVSVESHKISTCALTRER